jgi:hypothetical protein
METPILNKYYEDEFLTLELERYDNQIYLHVQARKWSPAVAKQAYSVLHTLFEDMKDSGYKEAWSITPNPKFAKVFGATTIREFNYENKQYEVVKWDLK